VKNLDQNLQLVKKLREQARARGVTVAQLAMARLDLTPLRYLCFVAEKANFWR
jgi:hypothetical protein